MAKKIGVIIQGPLVTYGQGPNNSVCGFDTFKTIVENIETIKLLGFEYIVSTWDPVSDLEINIVAQLREAKIDVLICKIPSMTDPDHRYKHHYGIMKGVDHLTACGKIEILINIRTDMIISRVLFNWIIAHIYSYPARMVVSELLKNEAFYIGDFVYAAKTEVIQKFLNNFLHFQSTNLHPSIASDIGIKTLVSNNVSVSFWNKLPIFLTFVRQLYYYNQNIPIWGNIIHNKISALPIKTNPPSISLCGIVFLASKILSHLGLDLR